MRRISTISTVAALLFYAATFVSIGSSQPVRVRGMVSDRSNAQPLPFANVRVGTEGRGTSANSEGRYSIEIPPGEYRFIVSVVGFAAEERTLVLLADTVLDFSLEPAVIVLPEVVITSAAEDPAYPIIREAIRRKKENSFKGFRFRFDSYSRTTFRSGKELASVSESFISGYKERGKELKEFILSTHTTENVKKFPFKPPVTLRRFTDLTEDTIVISRNSVLLPLAEQPFELYEYRLIHTRSVGSDMTYTIRVIPKSEITPLMKGVIQIDAATYALVGADLMNTEALRIPYVQDLRVRYRQAFAKYNGAWLPYYSENEFGASISIGGLLSIEPISMLTSYMLTSVQLSEAVPDSVRFAKRSVHGGFTSDTLRRANSSSVKSRRRILPPAPPEEYEPATPPVELTKAQIDSLRPLVLTEEERLAYVALDSSKTMETILKPKGLLSGVATVGAGNSQGRASVGLPAIVYEYLYYSNSRVEGIVLGGRISSDSLLEDWNVAGHAAYSFGRWKPDLRLLAGYYLYEGRLDKVKAEGYSSVLRWPDATPFAGVVNSVNVTLGGNDLHNYYKAVGFRLGTDLYFGDKFFFALQFTSERQESVTDLYRHALRKMTLLRENPPIQEGTDTNVEFRAEIGDDIYTVLGSPQLGAMVDVSASAPLLGSDFSYTRILAGAAARIATMYTELAFPPHLSLRIEGGTIAGGHGMQHLFAAPAAYSFFTLPFAFRGLLPYEITGSSIVMMAAEHNWRSLPLQAIGIDLLADYSLDIVTGVNAASASKQISLPGTALPGVPYWEVYGGISRVFGLFRAEGGYSSKKEPFFRIGLATIL